MSSWSTTFDFPDEHSTIAFARKIAPCLGAGDCVLLSGDIGAGKSFLCRAIIRSIFGQDIDVPSPTFTLIQTYETADFEIWHADLYRLTHVDEAIELGLEDAFEQALCLIEWPDRLAELAPKNALNAHMVATDTHHIITLSGPPLWGERLTGLSV